MRKLKLDLDHLAVESFDTADEKRGTGTVMGHDTIRCSNTCDTVDNYTCNGQYTCAGEATCHDLLTCRIDSCGDCNTSFCDTQICNP